MLVLAIFCVGQDQWVQMEAKRMESAKVNGFIMAVGQGK